MNNKIINVKDIPESHKEGRRTSTTTKQDAMTTHYRGTGVIHEMNGRDNFRIVHVSDGQGNMAPEGKIEMIHMQCRDGKSKLEMKMH